RLAALRRLCGRPLPGLRAAGLCSGRRRHPTRESRDVGGEAAGRRVGDAAAPRGADRALGRAGDPHDDDFLHADRHCPEPDAVRDVPTFVIIPAFIISELKTASTMGFVIFLPFVVIDMVVSLILMSMGMMMLPPVLVLLPFKILLFMLVDGWHLLTLGLSRSF